MDQQNFTQALFYILNNFIINKSLYHDSIKGLHSDMKAKIPALVSL